MNIILIGFMGVGKSEVGKRAASRLGYNFLDTDELIEKIEGRKISEMFEKEGEKYFRDLETESLKTLVDFDDFVLATGGGIILREENVKLLHEIGKVILLTAATDTILSRIGSMKNRPLLEDGEKAQKIKEILQKRDPIYNSSADHKIDTTKKDVDSVAEEIIKYAKGQS
ncbi:shikimate kinase [Candidatus Saganbacteria bacterium]|nr:shikimate kinase [Candidatus Saganbacteria bacterium]